MSQVFKFPTVVWGTKGFEFWTYLSLLLLYAQPKSILELGSGRSTSFLGDYAQAHKAKFASVETDSSWYNKSAYDLFSMGTKEKQVHLIPIDAGTRWYDLDQFRNVSRPLAPIDFLLIDAPNDPTGNSHGFRDSEVGVREINGCAQECQVMIVDDIHRKHVFETIDKMLPAPGEFEKYFYDYPIIPAHPNTLCVCVRRSAPVLDRMDEIQNAVGAKIYRDFTGDDCKEP